MMPVVGEQFGETLKRLRREQLMTQRQLARRSDVALSTIVNIERGHTEPRFETIRRLAAALEVDPRELVRAGTQG
jgi:transcriptional regulator with XRE-family HTH domain